MNELKAMRAFAQVADTGSFSSAARALKVAPAMVTRSIAALEAHLGARLITRTSRRTVLTDIGVCYLERVRGILQGVDEAEALARQAQAHPHGQVRLMAPTAFAVHQLAPRLPRFHRVHPDITVDMTATGPVETMDAAHDITIVVKQRPLDGDFVARRLARSEVIACATPEYLARHGRPTCPQELVEHQLLVPPLQRGMTLHRVGDDRSGGAGVTVAPRRPLLNSVSPDLHHAGALAGIGIAGLPSFAVEKALRDHSMEQVLPGWRLSALSIWACMPTRKHVPASTRAFMDFLLAEFGGDDLDPWMAHGRAAPARAYSAISAAASMTAGMTSSP